MFITAISILTVWTIGSFPFAVIVGRHIARHNPVMMPETQPEFVSLSVSAIPVNDTNNKNSSGVLAV